MDYRNTVFDLVFACLALLRAVSAQSCYYPDGTGADLLACNASLSGGSACCGKDDLCTDIGLCISHDGHWYRGGCTDSTFGPAPCYKECLYGKSLVTRYDCILPY